MVASIPVKVLSSKTVARTDAFLLGWKGVSQASITIIPGVYLDKSQLEGYPSSVFLKVNGRSMSIQEMGCAKAHFIARKEISTSEIGGIIFEDDARFIEPEMIVSVATDFLNRHRGQSRILNLCESPLSQFQVNRPRRSIKLLGHSPLAVAYVLTPEAATELNQANNLVTWVSDWPLSKVEHYVCVPALVAHGDRESGSEIAIELNGHDMRHKKYFLKKFQNLINPLIIFDFFRDKDKAWIFYFVFLAPIYWRVDLIKTKLGSN